MPPIVAVPSVKLNNKAPSTPSLREMITKAVADLREAQGSTARSIYEYVSTKFSATPSKVNNELQRVLKPVY